MPLKIRLARSLVVLAMIGCAAPPHQVPVYFIDSSPGNPTSCYEVYLGKGDFTDGLFVLPGDAILWINTTNHEIKFSLNDALFAEEEYVIPPQGRVRTVVLPSAGGVYEPTYEPCTGGPIGGPKVKVGDPTP